MCVLPPTQEKGGHKGNMGATASSIQTRVDSLVEEFSITEKDLQYYGKLIEKKMQTEKKTFEECLAQLEFEARQMDWLRRTCANDNDNACGKGTSQERHEGGLEEK